MTYTVEITGLPAGSSTLTTRRYCTGEGYADAAGNVWEPRIMNPGSFSRYMWTPGATRGRGQVSLGVVTIANADAACDFMSGWAFDGRPIVIKRDGTVVFAGTTDSVLASSTTVTIRLRDAMASVADKSIVTTRFAGTNVLPNGVEGLATDLKGLCKPLLIGTCINLSPVCVNTSLLIYQISHKAIGSVYGVMGNGADILLGVQRASLAALISTAPTAGTWDYCLGNDATSEGGYIRLGSSPGNNVITVHGRSVNYDMTATEAATVALTYAGVTASDIVVSNATFSGLTAGAVGYYCGTGETKVGDVVDALCGSVGASWATTRDGKFQIARLVVPTGTASTTFGEWQLVGSEPIQMIATEDDGRGIPPYEVALKHLKNWTILTGANVAGVVSSYSRNFFAQEYRIATARDTSIWNPDLKTGRNPTSAPAEITTLLIDQAKAQTEASRLLSVYGAQRRYLSIQVNSAHAATVDLGSIVTVNTTRFSLSGVLLLVTGMVEDYSSETTTLYLWG